MPGQSRSSVCIVIIDDDIREGNEKFRLLLVIPKTVHNKLNVWSGKSSHADVKIIGEDSNIKCLQITSHGTMFIIHR